MNLYKITIGHAAPKDWVVATVGYVLANNEEDVYDYIASEPELNGNNLFNSWKNKEDENFDLYNKKYKVIGEETFKEKIIRLKGEINDDSYNFGDAYYGITLYGWELITEDVEGLEKAIELKIVTQI